MAATTQETPSLLILGASTRSAAFSAIRAGFRPICADLFADADLQAIAQVLPIEDYPNSLPEVARTLPPCPWMYTGALENHPELIAAIGAAGHSLLGNSRESLQAVRDPRHVARLLADAGVSALTVRADSDPPPADGRWVLKPLRSAAGRGIHIWNHAACSSAILQEPHYFQQRCSGSPISALFVADRESSPLVGVGRQLIGQAWLNAARFAYCGTIGPIDVPGEIEDQIVRTGEVLAQGCRLQGLFGCDFLWQDGHVWLTEVNPRYTASVEVFEYALGTSLLDWHIRACSSVRCFGAGFVENGNTSSGCQRAAGTSTSREPLKMASSRGRRRPAEIVGKAIVYAPRDLVVPPLEEFLRRPAPTSFPPVADLPAVGSAIPAGFPVCTVLVKSETAGRCLADLQGRAHDLFGRMS